MSLKEQTKDALLVINYNNRITNRFSKLILLLFILTSTYANADDFGTLPGGGGDPSVAPINDWILPIMLFGIVFVFYIFNKRVALKK